MSGTTYIDQLTTQMAELEDEIARARHQMERDAIEAKAAALRQLADLHRQQAELAERLSQASLEHAETWSDLHKSVRLELDGLRSSFEKWLTAHQ